MKKHIILDGGYSDLNPVQFGQQNCPPGHAFGPYVRTCWLLHYVVSGKGIFRREGQTHSLRAGDIFVIPPYVETFYRADTEEPWHYIWVGFTGSLTLPQALQGPVIHLPGAEPIFRDMERVEHLEQGRTPYLCGKLWELMSLLWEQDAPRTDYIRQACSLMDAECSSGITVAQVAQALGLDRCYFSTLFRRAMGTSPQAYLLELRLSRAAELMRLHGESPTTAALSVGYQDICSFSRAFKKRYGLSPRLWRDQGGRA